MNPICGAETQHQFNARESDWGFTSFMPLSELYDPGRGYLANDTVYVEAEVIVRKVLDYWSYDSKKETGFVGLKNQGATCYMNSLLQTLYHIPYFRKVKYILVYFFVQFIKSCCSRLILSQDNRILYDACRLYTTCQQLRTMRQQQVYLWLSKVCSTSFSITTPVLRQKS